MREKLKKTAWVCLCFALLGGLAAPSRAAAYPDTDILTDTAAYLCEATPSPGVRSVGGEWTVMGLARFGRPVPDGYFEGYYAALQAYVKENNGVLHDKKYTEYARVILALTALGANPADVAGYNLLSPLSDYEKTVWQGINGPVWALIALDSGSYDMPVNTAAKTQATRAMYVDAILAAQCADGGFSLAGGDAADPDITGMALQALAKYRARDDVLAAVEQGLDCLSKLQRGDGAFETDGVATLESTAQVVVALCELQIPLDDARFVKEGGSLTDGLMRFYRGDGSFSHDLAGGGYDSMATEQAFYALVAADRSNQGRATLYRMDDAENLLGAASDADSAGLLPGRHPDVAPQPVIYDDVTFSDISGLACSKTIESLAVRGIIAGRGDDTFDPAGTMTRAEFCAVMVRALGLTPLTDDRFSDIDPESWYAGYVGTAGRYKVVNGVSDTAFSPALTISRQEAAAMFARAAKLTGLVVSFDDDAALRLLAAFDDGREVDSWARPSLAFCYDTGIYDDSEMEIRPKAAITRGEAAQALYNLLCAANFLCGG